MKMKDLTKYEGCRCRVEYYVESKKNGQGMFQSRTGYVRCVTTKLLILYIEDAEEDKEEIDIPLEDVESCNYLESF